MSEARLNANKPEQSSTAPPHTLAPSKVRSLYTKLAVTFTFLVITIGSAVVFLGYQSMRDYYQEITQELNKDVAMYMADSYQLSAQDLLKSRTELVRITERSMVLNPSLEIYLLDRDGNILDHNQPVHDLKRKHIELTPIKQFLSN